MLSLKDLQFPIYLIGRDPIVEEDGLIYKELYKINGEPDFLFIDDTSVEGDTLAKRRMQMGSKGVKLVKLNTAIFFVVDLVKYTKGTGIKFIDSLGTIFTYTKSKFYKLECRKIKNIRAIDTGGALIEVEGIHSRFKTLHMPTSEKYAGVLVDGMSYILYGIFDTEFKATRRKV